MEQFFSSCKITYVNLFGKGKIRRTKWLGAFNNINNAKKLITIPVLTITKLASNKKFV